MTDGARLFRGVRIRNPGSKPTPVAANRDGTRI